MKPWISLLYTLFCSFNQFLTNCGKIFSKWSVSTVGDDSTYGCKVNCSNVRSIKIFLNLSGDIADYVKLLTWDLSLIWKNAINSCSWSICINYLLQVMDIIHLGLGKWLPQRFSSLIFSWCSLKYSHQALSVLFN